MKKVSYDRGRMIDTSPEIVACLWSNWEIYDALLENKFKITRVNDNSWISNYLFQSTLTLETREANIDTGRFVFTLRASILGIPSATVVTLRYVASKSGETSVHGEFRSELLGISQLLEPLVRGKITKTVDEVIQGGTDSCILVSKNYEVVKSKLSEKFTQEIDAYLEDGKNLRQGKLINLRRLNEKPSPKTRKQDNMDTSQNRSMSSNNEVFIVHGRDDTYKHIAARVLEKLGLQPIILHEQHNAGRTIIEKFEDHSSSTYAIIILTPDDKGGLANDKQLLPRARQNVIFELGYFIGKLTRNRVCALYKEGVELPSDLGGVLFIPLDDGGAWKFKLAQELKATGLDIDLNKVVQI